jgi:hypothetical protein
MTDYGCDDDIPRNVTPAKEVVRLSTEMNIVIEARLFDLLDQVCARWSFRSVHNQC